MNLQNAALVIVSSVGVGLFVFVIRKRRDMDRGVCLSLLASTGFAILWMLCIWALYSLPLSRFEANLASRGVFVSVTLAGLFSLILSIELAGRGEVYRRWYVGLYLVFSFLVVLLVLFGHVSPNVHGSPLNYRPVYAWGHLVFVGTTVSLVGVLFLQLRESLYYLKSADGVKYFQVLVFGVLLTLSAALSIAFNALGPALGQRGFVLFGPVAMTFAFCGVAILLLFGEFLFACVSLRSALNRFGEHLDVESFTEALSFIGECASGGSVLRSVKRVSLHSADGVVPLHITRGFQFERSVMAESISEEDALFLENSFWKNVEDQGRLNCSLLAHAANEDVRLEKLKFALRQILSPLQFSLIEKHLYPVENALSVQSMERGALRVIADQQKEILELRGPEVQRPCTEWTGDVLIEKILSLDLMGDARDKSVTLQQEGVSLEMAEGKVYIRDPKTDTELFWGTVADQPFLSEGRLELEAFNSPEDGQYFKYNVKFEFA